MITHTHTHPESKMMDIFHIRNQPPFFFILNKERHVNIPEKRAQKMEDGAAISKEKERGQMRGIKKTARLRW